MSREYKGRDLLKANNQISNMIGKEKATELLKLPKRAIAAALIDLAALHNNSNCDDINATATKAIDLTKKFV